MLMPLRLHWYVGAPPGLLLAIMLSVTVSSIQVGFEPAVMPIVTLGGIVSGRKSTIESDMVVSTPQRPG